MILKRGQVPPTPHTEFRVNGTFTLEEIHGTYGFSGPHSRKVHLRSYPTEQVKAPRKGDFELLCEPAQDQTLQPYHLRTGRVPFGGDAIRARKPLVFGTSTILSVSKPDQSMPKDAFFKNGERHEVYFVQEGAGTFHTEYGEVGFRKGLYIVIPKGTTYRVELTSDQAFMLVIESTYPIDFPAHYLNRSGQATLSAPIVETEIEAPELKAPIDKRGEFAIDVKHGGGRITRVTLGHHPFDLVGWEGALYPFAFDVKNHHGIAREIHTAPPVHQTFESGKMPFNGFSLCSFVAQMEGWHALEVPAPYAHQNVDSDECMFFSNVNYGARKGVIEEGSLTFHPGSLPHSPQGAAAEVSTASRGKMNRRLAVMLDTFFESLTVTEQGYQYRDPEYPMSWSEAKSANRKAVNGGKGAKGGDWVSPSE